MATLQQQAFCVLRFAKLESVVVVQREFRKQLQRDPPNKTNGIDSSRRKGAFARGKNPGPPQNIRGKGEPNREY
jgi:hypothetical protein